MQRLGVEPACSFQRLAVNRDMARRCAAAGEPTELPGQGVAIKGLKNIVIGGMARRTLNAKKRQRLRFQPPSPAENGAQVIGPSEHRRNRDGKNRL